MKSTDERMKDVLGRARAREAWARRQRQRAVALGGGVLSVMAIVLVGVGVSSVAGSYGTSGMASQLGLMGSVFADGSALGYVVVGLLGMVVTVLVFRLGQGRGMFSYRDEDEISVHTSSENASGRAKAQVGNLTAGNMYTNCPDAPVSAMCSSSDGGPETPVPTNDSSSDAGPCDGRCER